MTKRTYGDGCPTAHAMDLIGERWALLAVRELMLGPRRFKDIRAGLPGISPNVLTQRLEELEEAGIVVRRRLPPPNSVQAYELTEWGGRLDGVMQALGQWAVQSPAMKGRHRRLGPVSLVLSLRARFDPKRGVGAEKTLTLWLDEQGFQVRFGNGEIAVESGEAKNADAVVITSSWQLSLIIDGKRSLANAIAAGDLQVDGSVAAVQAFVELYLA